MNLGVRHAPTLLFALLVPLLALLLNCASRAQSQLPSPLADAERMNNHSLDAIFSHIEADGLRAIADEKYPSMRKELERLAREYETQAAAGRNTAQFKLGAMYLEGIGLHVNNGRAFRRLFLAGGRDHPLALLALGRFHQMCLREDARDRRITERAIESLGKIGPKAAVAIPLLETHLHRGWYVAAAALARMGDPGVKVLTAALEDVDLDVRCAAALALSETGHAAQVPPALLDAVRTRPPPPQLEADVLAAHIRDLKHPDLGRRKAATLALHSLGDQTLPAVPALVEALSDPDRELRRYAAEVLQYIGRGAEAAAPALWQMALDDDAYTRQRAHDALRKVAPDFKSEPSKLIAELRSPILSESRRAAERLARLNEGAAPALADLVAALDDKRPEVRLAAVKALGNLRNKGHTAVDPLMRKLDDADPQMRTEAARALTYIGPGPRDNPGHGDVVPKLVAALGDSDPHVRSCAARALMNDWQGIDRALPALVPALDDFVPQNGNGACINAGYAIKEMAKRGHFQLVVTTALEALQKSPDNARLIDVLGAIGPDARQAILSLRTIAAGHGDAARAAALALTRIEPAAKPDLTSVLDRVYDDGWGERESGLRALGDAGEQGASAVPTLLEFIEDHDVAATTAFRAAADQGFAEAQFEFARQLLDGRGIAADANAAASWMRKAAENGHAEARRHLGILYRQGRGVPQNDKLAEEWYRQGDKSPSALARLRNRPVNRDAYQAAMQPHISARMSDFGPPDKSPLLILAVTRFSEDAGQATHLQIDEQGRVHAYTDLYNWSRRGGDTSDPLSKIAKDQAETLLRRLPVGVTYVPVSQEVVISFRRDGEWTTERYDSAALPRVLRNLLDLLNMPVGEPPYPPRESASWKCPAPPIVGLTFDGSGDLFSWSHAARVDLWKSAPSEEHQVRAFEGYPIAVAPATSRAVLSNRRRLKLVDLKTGVSLVDLGQSGDNNDRGRDAAFSADGRTLAVLDGRSARVHVWDAENGVKGGSLEIEHFSDAPPAVSANGRRLATSARSNGVLVWDLMTMRQEHQFSELNAAYLAFSPDGESLGALSEGSLVVLNLTTGEKLWSATSDGHGEPICFSPDGALIAQARRHPAVRLRNAQNGRLIGLMEGHTYDQHSHKSITALAFSADGKTLATGGQDGLIKRWTVADVLSDWGSD